MDLIVFATGFDTIDGSFNRIDFKGCGGKSLKDHWAQAPKTHLGATISDFPNLLFVNGPGAPFSNNPPASEESAQFVADLIAKAETIRKSDTGTDVIESTKEAEEQWSQVLYKVSEMTLFSKTPSWFFGENIPGKKL